MVGGASAKRRRVSADSASAGTPARKPGSGRGRGRPPNVPRDGRERPPSMAECFKKRCSDVLDRLSKKDHHDIFLEPVNTNDVVGYLDVIKNPMDFTTMRTKLTNQEYKSLGEFRKDLDLIWSNCLLFNGKEPTNVYSKKAIELRRLTEKLIVSTRQHLEKDKEAVQKWKEKHRKRRETMAANAAGGSAVHGVTAGLQSSSVSNQDGRSHRDTGLSHDHMDALVTTMDIDEGRGRSPEENALAEAMRSQYSGTTGLHRKNMSGGPLPSYTKPDGSISIIPIVRYNPKEDRWTTKDPLSRPILHYNLSLKLISDSLPPTRITNPCNPRPMVNTVLFSDYATSLFDFVKKSGQTPVDIVTELLSPELAIKAEQEELKRRGLSAAEISRRPNPIASGLHPPPKPKPYKRKRRWDVDDIVALATDIDKVNKRAVSVLPTPLRSMNELDGLENLVNLMGKDLCDEIEQVSMELVDTAMPYGAGLRSLMEILRIRASPGIRTQPDDLRAIEQIIAQTQEYVNRKGNALAPKIRGPALMTPSQLHEVQMRDARERKKRRLEAERQAAYISRYSVLDSDVRQNAPHQQGSNTAQNLAAGLVKPNVSPDAHINPLGSTITRQKENPSSIIASASHTGTHMMSQSSVANVHSQNDGFLQHPQVHRTTQANIGAPSMPASNKLPTCSSCGASETPSWHPMKVGSRIERFCFQCAHWQKFGQRRPKEMGIHAPSNRLPPSNAQMNSNTGTSLPLGFDSQSNNPNDLLSGINRQQVRRPSRSPTRSRRSPTTSHHSSGIHETQIRAELPDSANHQGSRALDVFRGQPMTTSAPSHLMDAQTRLMNQNVAPQIGKPNPVDVLFNKNQNDTLKQNNMQDSAGFDPTNANNYANQQRSEATTIPSQPNSTVNTAFMNYNRGKSNLMDQHIMSATEDVGPRGYNSMYKESSPAVSGGGPMMSAPDMKDSVLLPSHLQVNQHNQAIPKNSQKALNPEIGFMGNQHSAGIPVGNMQFSLASFQNTEPQSIVPGTDISNGGLSGSIMNEALDGDGMGEAVGSAEITNNNVNNNPIPGSGIIGFGDSRGIFGNGGSDEPGGSDQLVDNILFEEGGLATGGSGSGEFDF